MLAEGNALGPKTPSTNPALKGRYNTSVPQSLSRIDLHVVFSTKGRTPLIRKEELGELHSYMGGILRNFNCQPMQIGGIEDHVHLFFKLSRTITLADVVKEVKIGSSKWMKAKQELFAWQSGYAAFSVGKSDVARVLAYIQRQEEHHRVLTFQDELRGLLKEADVERDERYVWD